jgi:hypothetical protein
MSEKDEKEEGSQLDKFTASSMRGPKRGIYQQLLALLLIKANRSNDPLIKISCICEAALMSKKKKKLDMKLVHVCYTVFQSFQATEIVHCPFSWLHENSMIDIARVAWVFPQTEENYKKYIKEWRHVPLSYYTLHTTWRKHNYPFADRLGKSHFWAGEYQDYYNKTAAVLEEKQEKTDKDLEALPEWQGFYEKASAVCKRSFSVLQKEFSGWALPKLLETQAIISDEIDPEIWKETLATVSKDEKENVE